MLQSDTLANEFNEILNAVEIFAPFQPLDPAITFYAPLRHSLRDLRLNPDSFERASDAWYKDGSGIYRYVGINQPRFEEGRLLMEPAKTNACTNFSARPDPALTNVTLGGVGTLERIEDAAALSAMGLGNIGNGHAIRILSAGGNANANVVGNVTSGRQTVSAYIKKIGTTGNVFLRTANQQVNVEVTNQDYQRISASGDITEQTRFAVNTNNGGEAYFVLNQLEESPIVTSPIVTEGTAGQRAVDQLRYQNLLSFFDQAEGTLIFTFVTLFRFEPDTTGNKLLVVTAPTLGLSYHDPVVLKTFDGVSSRTISHGNSIPGDVFYMAVRWKTTPSELQVGFSKNGGAWAWTVVSPYDGSFTEDGFLHILPAIAYPYRISDVEIHEIARETAWIEANYP